MGPKLQPEERKRPWMRLRFGGGGGGVGGWILVLGGVLIAAAFAAHRARVRGKRHREKSASRSVYEQDCKENEEKAVEKSKAEKRFEDVFADDGLVEIKSPEMLKVKSNGRDGNSHLVFGELQSSDVAEMVEKEDRLEGKEVDGEGDSFVEMNGKEDEGCREIVKKEEEFDSGEPEAFVNGVEVKQFDSREAAEEDSSGYYEEAVGKEVKEIDENDETGTEPSAYCLDGKQRSSQDDSQEVEEEDVSDGKEDTQQLACKFHSKGQDSIEEAAQEKDIPVESHVVEEGAEGQEVMPYNTNEETKTFTSAVGEVKEENDNGHSSKEDTEQIAYQIEGKEHDSDEAAVQEEAPADEARGNIEGTEEKEGKESNVETELFANAVEENLVDSVEAEEVVANVKSNKEDKEQLAYKLVEQEPDIDQVAAAEEAGPNEARGVVNGTEEKEVKKHENSREAMLEEKDGGVKGEEGDVEEGTPRNEFHETEGPDESPATHVKEVEEKKDGSEGIQVHEFVVNGQAQSLVHVVVEKHTDLRELKEEMVNVHDDKEDTEQLAYEMVVKENGQVEALPNEVQAQEIEPLFHKADHVHGGEKKGNDCSYDDSEERQDDSEGAEAASESPPHKDCEENALLLVDDVVQNDMLADFIKEAETNPNEAHGEDTKLLICEGVQHDQFREVDLNVKDIEDKEVYGNEAIEKVVLLPNGTHKAEPYFSRATAKEEGFNAALVANVEKVEENQGSGQEDNENEDKEVKGKNGKTLPLEANEAKTHAEAGIQVRAVLETKATEKTTMKTMMEIEKGLDVVPTNQSRVAFLLVLFLVIALGLLSYHQYRLGQLFNKNAS